MVTVDSSSYPRAYFGETIPLQDNKTEVVIGETPIAPPKGEKNMATTKRKRMPLERSQLTTILRFGSNR